MTDNIPICVMSFNRSDYLGRVLRSLQRQRGCNIENRKIVLFQDGAVNPFSNKRHASDENINKCIDTFKSYFPNGDRRISLVNLGVALNFERAERHVFEELNADCAIFLEDDLVLSDHYISVLTNLIDSFSQDQRVGYVAAYGHHDRSLEEQRVNRNKLISLYHNWGFALYRRQWLKIRSYLLEYLNLIKDFDYTTRNRESISKLFASWGFGCPATSQDAAKTIACCIDGAIKVNTYACNATYIGERGLHMNPELFKKRGYENSILYPERIENFESLEDGRYEAILKEQLAWAGKPSEGGAAGVNPMESADPNSALIIAAYRALFERDPDPGGMSAYMRLFAATPPAEALQMALERLLKSTEFVRRRQQIADRQISRLPASGKMSVSAVPTKFAQEVKSASSSRPNGNSLKTAAGIVDKLFGTDVLAGYEPAFAEDLQGWNSDHPIFRKLISSHKIQVIFDVGVWKGGSTIALANLLREFGVDGAVVAIDTFLGSTEHWNRHRPDRIYDSLLVLHGYPHLYWQFLSNVKHRNCDAYVVPLAQTTENAARILGVHGIKADLIHLDAAHEYEPVLRDALGFWDLLNPGGFLVGDDYHPSWPGVVRGATEFAKSVGVELALHQPKWIARKPVSN